MIIKSITSQNNIDIDYSNINLYDKITGELYDNNQLIKDSNLINGSNVFFM